MSERIALWVLALAMFVVPACSAQGTQGQPADASSSSAAEKADTQSADAEQPGAEDKEGGAKDEAAPSEDEATTEPAEEPEPRKAPTHDHKSFKERVDDRASMVRDQIADRDVEDETVLEAMRTVPRHAFVREGDRGRAYWDTPLPIGLGQTISQPYIVGYMTEQLKLDDKDRVLEIGTGSGYQAAVCAEIAREVYTIEILKKLGEAAAKRLKELGYRNVTAKVADGYHGWAEHGPFDAIIVTAAAQHVPPPLVKQLKAGGRMVIPVGGPFAAQYLILVTKDDEGKVSSKSLLPVRFVPLTRSKE